MGFNQSAQSLFTVMWLTVAALSPFFHSGTQQFCPPEWFINRQYSGHPATVWSLGVLMFRLVCGYFPFNSKNEVINTQLQFPPGLSGGEKMQRHYI